MVWDFLFYVSIKTFRLSDSADAFSSNIRLSPDAQRLRSNFQVIPWLLAYGPFPLSTLGKSIYYPKSSSTTGDFPEFREPCDTNECHAHSLCLYFCSNDPFCGTQNLHQDVYHLFCRLG